MTDKKFAEVFISQYSAEARMVRQMLESNGLDAMLLDEYANGSVGGFGPAIPVRVVVPPDQAEAARALIETTDK
ncbi:MAG: DUF2007 domain-containing protein [Elusimicrobia bacterium]|nr:DUF2007 domain-containing protein [Elusimicrobiota bacterium]